MGKAGLIASTLLLAGFCVGLGFSSYHIVLNKNAKYEYKAQLESPEIRATLNYDTAAGYLDEVIGNFGKILIKDNQVLVVEQPDITSASQHLEDAALNLLYSSESKKYAAQVMDINKELIQLNEPEKEAEKYQNLEKKITNLKEDIIFLSNNALPKAKEIETLYYSKANRQSGSIAGAIGGSIGVIACTIWAGFQGYEVSKDLSYERRNNKRVKNRI